ncbi:oligosaccharide translocation rft1 [Fusarium longipes]|uniref:Oligosaccharide translocation rft1 n=1 Tax=Fusarium longipes TaxID=694270 RepID=A0A395SZC4_9HYPO|nr:oligosaccharide translocation rft1 [Fusarium longipes]
MAPLNSPKDLGLGQVLARALSSSTLSQPPTLVSRQTVETVTVTSTDNGNDAQTLSGGAIAGIVIGSIAGFLLLLWIIRSCLNLGAPPQDREKWYHYKEEPRRHHRSRSRRSSHRSSISVPPPIVVRDSRSRSHRRGRSPGYYGKDRGTRYYV